MDEITDARTKQENNIYNSDVDTVVHNWLKEIKPTNGCNNHSHYQLISKLFSGFIDYLFCV